MIIVTGPPCGGKSTFVTQHKQPGDVVIDADRMASALAGDDEVSYDHPEHIIRLAAAAHWRVRKLARRSSATVWLIFANPSNTEIQQYRSQGDRIVTVDPGRSVVEERCRSMRPVKANLWINEWYATHSEAGVPGGFAEDS